MPGDVRGQIEHWRRGAMEDWRVGVDLVRRKRVRHGLFFVHLALEKMLKAHVCRATDKPAPKLHSLPILAERAGVGLDPDQVVFLQTFDRYNMAGRYPEGLLPMPRHVEALELVKKATAVFANA